MLYGGFHLRPWEIGELTPGEIEDMVMYERAYAHNQAAMSAYHAFPRIRHQE